MAPDWYIPAIGITRWYSRSGDCMQPDGDSLLIACPTAACMFVSVLSPIGNPSTETSLHRNIPATAFISIIRITRRRIDILVLGRVPSYVCVVNESAL
jgi:hypothetical protein